MRHRAAVLIEHLPRKIDALSLRFFGKVLGQIVVGFANRIMAEQRSRYLGKRLRNLDQRLPWIAENRAAVAVVPPLGLRAWDKFSIAEHGRKELLRLVTLKHRSASNSRPPP
jgi:hypothetical protein